MLGEARRDGQVVKDQIKAEGEAEVQASRERFRREIDTAKDQALKEIYEQSVQLAALVSSKAIKREMTVERPRSIAGRGFGGLGKTNLRTATTDEWPNPDRRAKVGAGGRKDRPSAVSRASMPKRCWTWRRSVARPRKSRRNCGKS